MSDLREQAVRVNALSRDEVCFGGPAEFALLAAIGGFDEAVDTSEVVWSGDAEVEGGHDAGRVQLRLLGQCRRGRWCVLGCPNANLETV